MTALALLTTVIMTAPTYEELLDALPPNASIFMSQEHFVSTPYVGDFLMQHLDDNFLSGLRGQGNDLRCAWNYLLKQAVSIAEGRQRLAQLGAVKLTRAESPAPPNKRRERMSWNPGTLTKFNARSIDKDAKITVLAETNPRRAGTVTHKIFELYKNGMTVGEFVAAGGRLIDVKADIERKHISIESSAQVAENPEEPTSLEAAIKNAESPEIVEQHQEESSAELCCPSCSSKSIIKNGCRDNKQLYKCKECFHNFSKKSSVE